MRFVMVLEKEFDLIIDRKKNFNPNFSYIENLKISTDPDHEIALQKWKDDTFVLIRNQVSGDYPTVDKWLTSISDFLPAIEDFVLSKCKEGLVQEVEISTPELLSKYVSTIQTEYNKEIGKPITEEILLLILDGIRQLKLQYLQKNDTSTFINSSQFKSIAKKGILSIVKEDVQQISSNKNLRLSAREIQLVLYILSEAKLFPHFEKVDNQVQLHKFVEKLTGVDWKTLKRKYTEGINFISDLRVPKSNLSKAQIKANNDTIKNILEAIQLIDDPDLQDTAAKILRQKI